MIQTMAQEENKDGHTGPNVIENLGELNLEPESRLPFQPIETPDNVQMSSSPRITNYAMKNRAQGRHRKDEQEKKIGNIANHFVAAGVRNLIERENDV